MNPICYCPIIVIETKSKWGFGKKSHLVIELKKPCYAKLKKFIRCAKVSSHSASLKKLKTANVAEKTTFEITRIRGK